MGDIRTALEHQPPVAEGEDESLFEQLSESIQEYEISHPGLTSALQHALDILSGAGISRDPP